MRPHAERVLEFLVPALSHPDWRVRWFNMYMDARYRGKANLNLSFGKTVLCLRVGVKNGRLAYPWTGTIIRITAKNGLDKDTLAALRTALKDIVKAADAHLAAQSNDPKK